LNHLFSFFGFKHFFKHFKSSKNKKTKQKRTSLKNKQISNKFKNIFDLIQQNQQKTVSSHHPTHFLHRNIFVNL
jgi:hypothetical protein